MKTKQCKKSKTLVGWTKAPHGPSKHPMDQDTFFLCLMVAESAAAISDGVHNNEQKFRQLYESVRNAWSGFPGIWNFCAQCALELQRQHPGEWSDGWIEVCNTIAEKILAATKDSKPALIVQQALKETPHE